MLHCYINIIILTHLVLRLEYSRKTTMAVDVSPGLQQPCYWLQYRYPYFPWDWTATTCDPSVFNNDVKCKYIFMFRNIKVHSSAPTGLSDAPTCPSRNLLPLPINDSMEDCGNSWRHHDIETLSTLLDLCEGHKWDSPNKRPVIQNKWVN